MKVFSLALALALAVPAIPGAPAVAPKSEPQDDLAPRVDSMIQQILAQVKVAKSKGFSALRGDIQDPDFNGNFSPLFVAVLNRVADWLQQHGYEVAGYAHGDTLTLVIRWGKAA